MVVLDFTTAAVILLFSFALGKVSLVPLMIAVLMIVGIPVIVVQILGMSDTALGITQGAFGLGGLRAELSRAQQQTPPNLLGKIMAVIIAVSSCSQPLGQAVLEKESAVK